MQEEMEWCSNQMDCYTQKDPMHSKLFLFLLNPTKRIQYKIIYIKTLNERLVACHIILDIVSSSLYFCLIKPINKKYEEMKKDGCRFFGLFGRVFEVFLPNVSPVFMAGLFRGPESELCALVQFVGQLSNYSCGISFCPFQAIG